MMIRLLFPLIIIGQLFLSACGKNISQAKEKIPYSIVEGETMGTYYRVTYSDTVDYKTQLDSILRLVNAEVSTYIPQSSISRFNKDSIGIQLGEGIFWDNFKIANEVYKKSEGYYDPTVMPLVNYWGFGYTGKKAVERIDSIRIKEMKSYVGLENIEVRSENGTHELIKLHPKTELDFSSVAKGYGVDLLSNFLEDIGIDNFLVDIGGEMMLKGLNPKAIKWSIGINTPKEDAAMNESILYLGISDFAIATSGNYRNFYDSNGLKISHTINPKSGFPERSNLLSVTIIAKDCARADAYATACMVLGSAKAEKMISKTKDLKACFIISDGEWLETKYFNNFEAYILE